MKRRRVLTRERLQSGSAWMRIMQIPDIDQSARQYIKKLVSEADAQTLLLYRQRVLEQ